MQLFALCDMRTGREISSEKWESGKVYSTASGDMVRSNQERLIADLLTSEGIPFEYERRLLGRDGSVRRPDFTLFIDGEQYYWEHWGMVDDNSYRQSMARKIRWYRSNGYHDSLIQTWGGGGRNLRGQILAELYKLRGHKQESETVYWGWGFILFAVVLILFLFYTFFSSQQPHSPVTISEPPKSTWQKPVSGKQFPAEKRPELIHDAQTGKPNKKNPERLYMGIRISLPDKTRSDEENRVRD